MEVTDLRAERDQAQKRLFSIASLLPSALGPKRARSESDSPAQSARVSKAARSTSGPFPAGALSQGPASRSLIVGLSAVAAGQKSEGPASSPPFAGLPDHLPRSARSTAKGGHGGASSSPAASDVPMVARALPAYPVLLVGSDSSSPELSRAKDQFGMPSGPLSDAELADLPSTTVPRSEWIPGYRDRRNFRSHDIVPWSAQDIRQASILEMDSDLLFHHYTKPMEWLIPLRDPVHPLGEWRDDLVDESNVRDLIESAPWEILAAKIDPLRSGLVSIAKRRASRYLEVFYTDRKQRRSRAGAQWKSFLQQVLIGLLRGYCDLDLLLDPFFLHFSRPGEAGAWYPGIEDGADPADLLEALIITNAADR
ncbi:hypothetical protein L917_14194 [Phytophthora nicotianae]|uniref:Uncharacterized protein n=1 Tax=Phytophthora nicotianae TaxID=4792 RepID=W2KMT9_PHYNI|nr:hypothetical protein L917_14194 [Phytophthora nicotianae]